MGGGLTRRIPITFVAALHWKRAARGGEAEEICFSVVASKWHDFSQASSRAVRDGPLSPVTVILDMVLKKCQLALFAGPPVKEDAEVGRPPGLGLDELHTLFTGWGPSWSLNPWLPIFTRILLEQIC